MNKTISLIIVCSLLLLGCSPSTEAKLKENSSPIIAQENGQLLPIEATVKMGEQVIELEVAKTPEQQQIGLMYRKSIEKNRGMIFLFDELRPVRFWMKNVTIPLDMIFLANGKVKAIISEVPPCNSDPCPTYGPDSLVNQVIELGGGEAKKLGIKEEDKLDIKFLENSP
ncbi:DUF192 domain-containing protein [Crocosphaera sp. XPORK-15E]|uniref:DUF192 domain-containing protein n=1 Tax=Crocosphaera sp. XPORK-15E TaxID=3110247 RepID=UPI002B1EF5C2|nr:DUF192 domain-containing protein [Crocosphaera sp. XPORK-15E]MEA5536254.1 DUF192 domain-containing protein [Crocosphaera sp. XPORK-15E]